MCRALLIASFKSSFISKCDSTLTSACNWPPVRRTRRGEQPVSGDSASEVSAPAGARGGCPSGSCRLVAGAMALCASGAGPPRRGGEAPATLRWAVSRCVQARNRGGSGRKVGRRWCTPLPRSTLPRSVTHAPRRRHPLARGVYAGALRAVAPPPEFCGEARQLGGRATWIERSRGAARS